MSPHGEEKTREFLRAASLFLNNRSMDQLFPDNPKLFEELLLGKKIEAGEAYGPPFPLALNGKELAKTYGLLTTIDGIEQPRPSTFLVDQKGIIRFAHIGKNPTDRPSPEALRKAVAALPPRR